MDCEEVGCGGEGDRDTGGLRGDVGVVALAVGEGVELQEGGGVVKAGELLSVVGQGDSGEVRLAMQELV